MGPVLWLGSPRPKVKKIGDPSAEGGGDIQAETMLVATFRIQVDHGCLREPIYTSQLNGRVE